MNAAPADRASHDEIHPCGLRRMTERVDILGREDGIPPDEEETSHCENEAREKLLVYAQLAMTCNGLGLVCIGDGGSTIA